MKVKTQYEQLIRLALTGQEVGPNIYKIMEFLGQEECMRRINTFVQKYTHFRAQVNGTNSTGNCSS